MADPIRVLVVDDHAMVAESMRRVLNAEPDIAVVAAVGTGEAAVAEVGRQRVAVVLLDYQLPDADGIEVTMRLHAIDPDVAVLMVTGGASESTLARALEAGCVGFLSKGRALDELVAAVRAAARGEAVIDPGTLSRLLPKLRREPAAMVPSLTAREMEVLGLLAEGLASRAIAAQLVVSHHTARNHVRNLLAKLGAHSQLEAVALATRAGLLDRH